jgi:DNA-binding MarR family transcriptional regulator
MWQDGPIPTELTRFTGYLMARLGQRSSRRFALALEPLGLHPKHFGVLTIVAAQPGITQNALRDRTAIDPSSMVAVIDELEERGLAERRPHPTDRRARTVYVTEEGERTIQLIRELGARLQDELFGALTEDEQRTLHQLLVKLASASPPGAPPATAPPAGAPAVGAPAAGTPEAAAGGPAFT